MAKVAAPNTIQWRRMTAREINMETLQCNEQCMELYI